MINDLFVFENLFGAEPFFNLLEDVKAALVNVYGWKNISIFKYLIDYTKINCF